MSISSQRLFRPFQRIALPVVTAALLAACASPEIAPPTEEELNRVSLGLLENAVYTDSVLRECSRVGPEAKAYSADLREVWQSLHGDALAGADEQYQRYLQAGVVEYRGRALALSAIHFAHEHQGRAREELRLNTRSDTNQRIVCERRLEELEQTIDTRAYVDSERDQLALAQLREAPAGDLAMSDVPTLAGGVPLEQDPGRSYREVEAEAKEQCTGQSELVVIHTDWPYEAYGAYCQDEPRAFIECEWGQCRER